MIKYMYNYNVTKEILEKYVNESEHYSEVLKKLGWRVHTNFYKRLKILLYKYKIDYSHFKKFNEIKHKKYDLKDILLYNSSYKNGRHLKVRLIKEGLLKYECSICKISSWLNKPITLHLDHINGVYNDNRLVNLRLLCPNCHSQTDTYAGRNSSLKNTHKVFYCIDCGNIISSYAKRCLKCSYKSKKKMPKDLTKEELYNEIIKLGYNGTGRKYGVCGSTIKKWSKNNN